MHTQICSHQQFVRLCPLVHNMSVQYFVSPSPFLSLSSFNQGIFIDSPVLSKKGTEVNNLILHLNDKTWEVKPLLYPSNYIVKMSKTLAEQCG